ncbi:hypothetical protein SDJN03_16620, partial [Cucurbita argyrosperma subsp. sororia]
MASLLQPINATVRQSSETEDYGAVGVHHVGVLCENLERSLHFYLNILGLKINEARPHDKLPYRGAWLWVGAEMIHLMELPDPDPLSGRPEHGGRDRHTCIGIRDVSKLKVILDKAGIPYTLSKSGRPAISTRDPDANALEFTQDLEITEKVNCNILGFEIKHHDIILLHGNKNMIVILKMLKLRGIGFQRPYLQKGIGKGAFKLLVGAFGTTWKLIIAR